MRPITVTLLSTCAVCALAQGPRAALAQTAPNANQPPSPTFPTKPTDPPLPTNTDPTSPMNPPLPSNPSPPTTTDPATPTSTDPANPANPASSDPANPANPATPPLPSPSTDTTTTPPVTPASSDTADSSEGGTDMYSYAWTDERLQSGIGVSAILGGGVTGFTDKTMRDTTSSVGGLWDLRVTIGSHIPLALDVSYLGSAMNINGLTSGRNGRLIGTTVEGALRYNVLPHFDWNPYVFAGAGWQRYDVTQTNVTLSDSGMNDSDNLLELPMGAGLQYRRGGFVGDLRGTFRAATSPDLVLKRGVDPTVVAPTSSDFAPMHTWEASAAVGYEF